MQTIRISEKDAVAKSITIKGYITEATHTRLSISGVSLMDMAQLHIFKQHMFYGHNAVVLNLNSVDYSIVSD